VVPQLLDRLRAVERRQPLVVGEGQQVLLERPLVPLLRPPRELLLSLARPPVGRELPERRIVDLRGDGRLGRLPYPPFDVRLDVLQHLLGLLRFEVVTEQRLAPYTLHTAMEAYARDRHGRNNFRVLRDYAGVPPEITGCTNPALALIGASRRYFAHLGRRPEGPTINEIETNTLLSTRRASALMQACLLREVGFSTAEVEGLLSDYYSRWPLS
jgi:hypothetical protein